MDFQKMTEEDWKNALTRYLAGSTAKEIYAAYLAMEFKGPKGKKLNFNSFAARLCKMKARHITKNNVNKSLKVLQASVTETAKETLLSPDLIAEFIWKNLTSEQKQKLIASHINKSFVQ